jgi:hypothetical protein
VYPRIHVARHQVSAFITVYAREIHKNDCNINFHQKRCPANVTAQWNGTTMLAPCRIRWTPIPPAPPGWRWHGRQRQGHRCQAPAHPSAAPARPARVRPAPMPPRRCGRAGHGWRSSGHNRLECGKLSIGVCTGGRRLAFHRGYPFGFLIFSLKSIINHCPLSESGKSLAFCGKGAPGANPNSGLPPVLNRRAAQASAR